jgi:hypothetical protein
MAAEIMPININVESAPIRNFMTDSLVLHLILLCRFATPIAPHRGRAFAPDAMHTNPVGQPCARILRAGISCARRGRLPWLGAGDSIAPFRTVDRNV